MSAAVDRFREVLARYAGKQELVEIFEDEEETDIPEVGMVLSVSEDYYSLSKVDAQGRPDGSYVGLIEDIRRIGVGTQYLAAIELLYQRHKSATLLPYADEPKPTFDSMLEVLEFAQVTRQVVCVLTDELFFGFVGNFTSEHVEIREVNKSGIEDGIQFLDLDQVVRIDFGGPAEEARRFLHQVRLGL
ncbi:MAG TPA: hypothetical protein VK171_09500 [Fimbriimonas sp.]|nr:hypothetical protein [Fimbriimonas sp.]